MALQKDIETNYGNIASYWKVISTNIDWHGKTAEITLAGFIDKDARVGGKAPIVIYRYNVINDKFTFSPENNVLTTAYELIKKSEEHDASFIDAQDI
jgi:hypothetical protein